MCTCAKLEICDTSTGTCVPIGVTQTWQFDNQCNDGEIIQLRLYDENANLQWPSGTLIYPVTYGQTNSVSITCTSGDMICPGGEDPNGLYVWGVGLNNNYPAGDTSQCTPCASETLAAIELTCN